MFLGKVEDFTGGGVLSGSVSEKAKKQIGQR